MSSPLVIYHAKCYDGFTAAWIAREKYPKAELHAATYGDIPPDVGGRRVYVLDFSYPREVMEKMNREAKNLLVLDHHKTSEADCEGLEFCEFDMNRSGCGMAWDHWFPDQPRPEWIKRIEDRDLWRFSYPDTAQVHAYIASFPMTMENWTAIHEMEMEDIEIAGESIVRYISTYIEKTVLEARQIHIESYLVATLNIPYQNTSETASVLLAQYPDCDYSMGYFQRSDGKWQYSLRSRSKCDVSEIARRYGGGGHAQAAGFDTPKLLMDLQ